MKQTISGSLVTRVAYIAMLAWIIFFVLFLYTFLHEAGHALAGFVFGQTLTEFDLSFWDLSAHVNMAGSLTQTQRAIQSAAGAALPLLVWLIFISLVPRRASFSLEALKVTASMAVVNTLLVWIVLPVLVLFGRAPSDDVISFLRHSHMQPLLLSGLAAALYTGGWLLFLSKIDGLRKEILLFGEKDPALLASGARRTMAVMASVMIACLFLAFSANRAAARIPLGQFAPPQDFQPVAQIDLSSRAYSEETLAQFSFDQATWVGVFIAVRDIHTTYFDLSVTGPGGYHSVILHGEGYRADQDGGLWEQDLPPGAYRLVLTSERSPGSASVYLKYR
jgi:hypothetical protein